MGWKTFIIGNCNCKNIFHTFGNILTDNSYNIAYLTWQLKQAVEILPTCV